MIERFTPEALQLIVDAQEEARDLGHTRIGTEHLLLAALDDSSSPVRATLAELGVTYADVRAHVVTAPGGGRRWSVPRRQSAASRHIPFTRKTKRSLGLALREANDLGSREITTAHVVLGTMRAGGLASRAVSARGVTPEEVRRAMLDWMGHAA